MHSYMMHSMLPPHRGQRHEEQCIGCHPLNCTNGFALYISIITPIPNITHMI